MLPTRIHKDKSKYTRKIKHKATKEKYGTS